MNNDTRIQCPDCSGTGRVIWRTSHGRAWKSKCDVCHGRKYRKLIYNVCNAANNDAKMLHKKQRSKQGAEQWVEKLVSQGYSRENLYIIQH